MALTDSNVRASGCNIKYEFTGSRIAVMILTKVTPLEGFCTDSNTGAPDLVLCIGTGLASGRERWCEIMPTPNDCPATAPPNQVPVLLWPRPKLVERRK